MKHDQGLWSVLGTLHPRSFKMTM